jgi:hypothetical protein
MHLLRKKANSQQLLRSRNWTLAAIEALQANFTIQIEGLLAEIAGID